MCETRKSPDYLDQALNSTDLRVVRIKETPCPLPEPRPIVVVYASAENVPSSERARDLETVKFAAAETYRLLAKRGHALDAVETAIKSAEAIYRDLEELNNAEDKATESDAGILEDDYLHIGSVGGVRKFQHPISLAKYVMRETDHVLIVSDGADYLVEELDPEDKGDDTSLLESFKCSLKNKRILCRENKTDGRESKVDEIENELNEEKGVMNLQAKSFGAVAYDIEKQKSCGLSVCRIEPESFGGLSSSATILGCGFYGTRDACVCVSGNDRTMYTQAPARAIIEGVNDEVDLKKSMELQLDKMRNLTCDKTWGAVAVDSYGTPFIVFKAASFPWAYCKNRVLFYGAASGEFFCEKIQIPSDEDEESLVCCCSEDKRIMQCDDVQ